MLHQGQDSKRYSFVICADFETMLRERYLQKIIYVKYKKHKPCGFPMPIKFAYDE